MPQTIQLDNLIVGLCIEGALEGEEVSIVSKEFSSSEDGNDFIARLEGVSGSYLAAFEACSVPLSRVETFLAVVKPSKEATVYINELRLVVHAKIQRVKPPLVSTGEPIYLDDIADIDTVALQDFNDLLIKIPADCGFALILSCGWRKALYYDYSVFAPDSHPRKDNLERLFGHFFARLMFQQLYSTTDAQWERLFEWGWFLFIGLKDYDRKSLLGWTKRESKPVAALEQIARHFIDDLDERLVAWEKHDYFNNDRMIFLRLAKERLDAEDYVSCISPETSVM